MSESTETATADTSSEAADNSSAGEGTTPQEVAEVLKSSGINLPDGSVDDEEGDDPDAAASSTADDTAGDDTADDPAEDEEVAEDKKPEAKPAKADDVGPPELDDKYSFQVEDANGVTFKITADADIEDVLKEFDPKNNGQIIKILDQLREVKDLKKADDAQAADDATKAEKAEQTQQFLKTWDEEAKTLQGAKRIPAGEDGEKRVGEVYKYMADQNTQRIKDGKPTLNSFEDALDKLENKEARDKVAADAKAEKEAARANGGKVGGASAPASSGPTIYKAGSAKNVGQAIRAVGLLE